MNARSLALLLGAAVAPAAGCGGDAPRTTVRVNFWNGSGAGAPARPATVLLNWLDGYGFLQRDHPFAIPSAVGDFLGSVVIGAYVADAGPRRAFARGQTEAGQSISEGWATGVVSPDEPDLPFDVTLTALPAGAPDPNDADGDGVPDPVDNCPGLANPDQRGNDC